MTKSLSVAFLFVFVGAGSVANAETLTAVSFGTGPTNWNVLSPDVTSLSNLIDETGAATGLSATFSASAPRLGTSAVVASSIPTHNPSLAALNNELYNAGTSGALTATISGLAADTSYGVYAFGLEFGSSQFSQTVTITGSGGATSFTQNLLDAQLTINSQNGSSANTLDSYEIFVMSSDTGTISFNFQSASPVNYRAAGIAIGYSAVPEPSSIILTVSAATMALGYFALARRRRKTKVGV